MWEKQRIEQGVKWNLSSREDAAWDRSEKLDLQIRMLGNVNV